MIDNIKEYIKLADSNNLEDNNRTKMEQLSSEVISEIIHNYPERKAWLVHNKHIPTDVLRLLCTDSNSDVRFTVAMKNKNDRYIFETLMKEMDLLRRMADDKSDKIATEAMRVLKLRNRNRLDL